MILIKDFDDLGTLSQDLVSTVFFAPHKLNYQVNFHNHKRPRTISKKIVGYTQRNTKNLILGSCIPIPSRNLCYSETLHFFMKGISDNPEFYNVLKANPEIDFHRGPLEAIIGRFRNKNCVVVTKQLECRKARPSTAAT